jgi:hypothetical protein
MGKRAAATGTTAPELSKAERKAQRMATRRHRPGLLDRATRLVLALFVLSAVAQHTLPGVG